MDLIPSRESLKGHGPLALFLCLKDYFHIYWSKSKILFYACVEKGYCASLTIAHEK